MLNLATSSSFPRLEASLGPGGMSCGKPWWPPPASLGEMIEDGGTGFLVEPTIEWLRRRVVLSPRARHARPLRARRRARGSQFPLDLTVRRVRRSIRKPWMSSGALVSSAARTARSPSDARGRPTCPGCARTFGLRRRVGPLAPRADASRRTRTGDARSAPTWQRLFFHKPTWLEWCQGLAARPGRRRPSSSRSGAALLCERVGQGALPRPGWSHTCRHATCSARHPDGGHPDPLTCTPPSTPEPAFRRRAIRRLLLQRSLPAARSRRTSRDPRVLAPGGRYLGIERRRVVAGSRLGARA